MKTIFSDSDLKELVLQLQHGDESAFNKLYLYYSTPLYKKINSIVKDESISDEILQDLFLKVWEKKDSIKIEHSFAAFLYTVANNLVYDYLRKVSKDKRLQARLMINAVDYYLQIEEQLIGKETNAIIQQAISQLSEQRRNVFILCKLEGRSYQEAADILGVSVSTINSHIVNSTRFIKKYLYKNQELHNALIVSIVSTCIFN